MKISTDWTVWAPRLVTVQTVYMCLFVDLQFKHSMFVYLLKESDLNKAESFLPDAIRIYEMGITHMEIVVDR